ncbi:MAG: hypothetical protein JJU02_16995 [Cryomorphaceae bacterium]|nr:hypothetical protein [Cryomorphaceae bacterium]
MTKPRKHLLTGLFTFMLLLGHAGYGQDTLKSNLEFDHILLFVNNEALKDSLDKIFTPAEKLTTEHKNQGTIGYYYLFYNTYIELIFLQDSINAKLNTDNFGSDYLLRWSGDKGYCPIGFGMLMPHWDTIAANNNFHKYQSSDSPNDEYYLMSYYNNDLSKPFIYISQPHRAYKSLESFEDIDERPDEIRDDLKKYLSHRIPVRRISQIIYSHMNENKDEGNMKILQESTIIDLEKSNVTSLTLVFDKGRNEQKEFILNDQTKLIFKF